MCFFILVSFCPQPNVYAQMAMPLQALALNVNDIQINSSFASLENRFASQKNKKVIVAIQDAHGIFDAQKNIQLIIQQLQDEHNFKLVGLEGGVGKREHRFLRSFPDPEINHQQAYDYMKRAELSGGEVAAIVNPKPGIFYGLEDKALYFQNRSEYLKALSFKDANLHTLHLLNMKLDKIRDKIFPESLKDFHKKEQMYLKERLALWEFLPILFEQGMEEGVMTEDRVPQIIRIYQAMAEAKKQQQKQRQLQEELTSKIEARALFEEIDWLREEIKTSLVGGSSEEAVITSSATRGMLQSEEKEIKTLIKLYNHLHALKQLSSLEISRKEWDVLAKTELGIERLEVSFDEFLKKHEEEIQLPLRLKPAIHFYEDALKRDTALYQNLTHAMKEEKQDRAIIVAGGFHTRGMSDWMEKEGVSYVVVTPRIHNIEKDNRYQKVMEGDVSYKNKSRFAIQTILATMGLSDDETAFRESYAQGSLNQVLRSYPKESVLVLEQLSKEWKEAVKTEQNLVSLINRVVNKVLENLSPEVRRERMLSEMKRAFTELLGSQSGKDFEELTQMLGARSSKEELAERMGVNTKELAEAYSLGEVFEPVVLTEEEIQLLKEEPRDRIDGGEVLLLPRGAELELRKRLEGGYPNLPEFDLGIKNKDVLVVPGYSMNGFLLAEYGNTKSVTVYDLDPSTIAWLKAIKKYWNYKGSNSSDTVGEIFMYPSLETDNEMLIKAMYASMRQMIRKALSEDFPTREKGAYEWDKNIAFEVADILDLDSQIGKRSSFDFVFIPWLFGQSRGIPVTPTDVFAVLEELKKISKNNARVMITPIEPQYIEKATTTFNDLFRGQEGYDFSMQPLNENDIQLGVITPQPITAQSLGVGFEDSILFHQLANILIDKGISPKQFENYLKKATTIRLYVKQAILAGKLDPSDLIIDEILKELNVNVVDQTIAIRLEQLPDYMQSLQVLREDKDANPMMSLMNRLLESKLTLDQLNLFVHQINHKKYSEINPATSQQLELILQELGLPSIKNPEIIGPAIQILDGATYFWQMLEDNYIGAIFNNVKGMKLLSRLVQEGIGVQKVLIYLQHQKIEQGDEEIFYAPGQLEAERKITSVFNELGITPEFESGLIDKVLFIRGGIQAIEDDKKIAPVLFEGGIEYRSIDERIFSPKEMILLRAGDSHFLVNENLVTRVVHDSESRGGFVAGGRFHRFNKFSNKIKVGKGWDDFVFIGDASGISSVHQDPNMEPVHIDIQKTPEGNILVRNVSQKALYVESLFGRTQLLSSIANQLDYAIGLAGENRFKSANQVAYKAIDLLNSYDLNDFQHEPLLSQVLAKALEFVGNVKDQGEKVHNELKYFELNTKIISLLVGKIQREEDGLELEAQKSIVGGQSWIGRALQENEKNINLKSQVIYFYQQHAQLFPKFKARLSDEFLYDFDQSIIKMVSESIVRKQERGGDKEIKAAIKLFYQFAPEQFFKYKNSLGEHYLHEITEGFISELSGLNDPTQIENTVDLILMSVQHLLSVGDIQHGSDYLDKIKSYLNPNLNRFNEILSQYPSYANLLDENQQEAYADQTIIGFLSSKDLAPPVVDRADVRTVIREGKPMKGTFQDLLWTHNTSPELFKAILKSGQIEARNQRRGANFRYGLDSEFGAIKMVMKKGFEEKYIGSGVSEGTHVDQIFYDFFNKAKNFYGKEMNEAELRRAIATDYEFRQYLSAIPEGEHYSGGDEHYQRTYLNPQLQIRVHVGLFENVERFLIPEHLYDEMVTHARNTGVNEGLISRFQKVSGTGKTDKEYYVWKRGSLDSQEVGDASLAMQLGYKRPSYVNNMSGSSSRSATGAKAFFEEEKAYFSIMANQFLDLPVEEEPKELSVTTVSENQFQSLVSKIFSSHGIQSYQSSGWRFFAKGRPVEGVVDPTQQWKLFLNPKPEHFFEVMERVMKVLEKEPDVLGKIPQSNRSVRKGNRVFENPHEPKLLLYIRGAKPKEDLVRIVEALEKEFSPEEIERFGFGMGLRGGRRQWGPSFTKKRNRLIYYTQGGYAESGRREAISQAQGDTEQIRIKLSSLFEGENFYRHKGERDPFEKTEVVEEVSNRTKVYQSFLEPDNLSYIALEHYPAKVAPEAKTYFSDVVKIFGDSEIRNLDLLKKILGNYEEIIEEFREGELEDKNMYRFFEFVVDRFEINLKRRILSEGRGVAAFFSVEAISEATRMVLEEVFVQKLVGSMLDSKVNIADLESFQSIQYGILSEEEFPDISFDIYQNLKFLLQGLDAETFEVVLKTYRLASTQLQGNEEQVAQVLYQHVTSNVLKTVIFPFEGSSGHTQTYSLPPQVKSILHLETVILDGKAIFAQKKARRIVDRAIELSEASSLGSETVSVEEEVISGEFKNYLAAILGYGQMPSRVDSFELLKQFLGLLGDEELTQTIQGELQHFILNTVSPSIFDTQREALEQLVQDSAVLSLPKVKQRVGSIVDELLSQTHFEAISKQVKTKLSTQLNQIFLAVLQGVNLEGLQSEMAQVEDRKIRAEELWGKEVSAANEERLMEAAILGLKAELSEQIRALAEKDVRVQVVTHIESLPVSHEEVRSVLLSALETVPVDLIGKPLLDISIYYTLAQQERAHVIHSVITEIRGVDPAVANSIHLKKRADANLTLSLERHKKRLKPGERLIYMIPDLTLLAALREVNVLEHRDQDIPHDFGFVKEMMAEAVVGMARALDMQRDDFRRTGFLAWMQNLGFGLKQDSESQQWVITFNLEQFVQHLVDLKNAQRLVARAA